MSRRLVELVELADINSTIVDPFVQPGSDVISEMIGAIFGEVMLTVPVVPAGSG